MAIQFLVVDDDETFRSLMVTIIQQAYPAAVIHDAATNEQALRLLEDVSPQLITTDINPFGKGYQFIAEVRRSPNAKLGFPVLAARKNEEAGLYPGRIYTRTSSAESAEVQHSHELRKLLSRLNRHN